MQLFQLYNVYFIVSFINNLLVKTNSKVNERIQQKLQRLVRVATWSTTSFIFVMDDVLHFATQHIFLLFFQRFKDFQISCCLSSRNTMQSIEAMFGLQEGYINQSNKIRSISKSVDLAVSSDFCPPEPAYNLITNRVSTSAVNVIADKLQFNKSRFYSLFPLLLFHST